MRIAYPLLNREGETSEDHGVITPRQYPVLEGIHINILEGEPLEILIFLFFKFIPLLGLHFWTVELCSDK